MSSRNSERCGECGRWVPCRRRDFLLSRKPKRECELRRLSRRVHPCRRARQRTLVLCHRWRRREFRRARTRDPKCISFWDRRKRTSPPKQRPGKPCRREKCRHRERLWSQRLWLARRGQWNRRRRRVCRSNRSEILSQESRPRRRACPWDRGGQTKDKKHPRRLTR